MKPAHWLCAGLLLVATLPSWAGPQVALVIKPLAEKTVDKLPDGPLFWRIETLPSRPQADTAAGPAALVAESSGKVWLFTLGGKGGSTPGATEIGEVGPIPRIEASRYLLRINDASGPTGAVTSVHSHPGSEAFYVLSGQQSIRGEHGTVKVDAGHAEPGHGAGAAMQVSSSGSEPLHALVMFVVDADKPFSSPATLP
jgi:mannose-6-phosphate isomerase-like protein (cupin superfamily)